MKITINTGSYNHRRYGKPWIAKVDFDSSAKGEFSWGEWTGDHYNGGEGVLSIDTNPGDIIAKGQKDNRQPRNSAPDFFIVSATGDLDSIGDKGNAYKYFLERKTATPDVDELKAERKKLIDRIAEIDGILNAQ